MGVVNDLSGLRLAYFEANSFTTTVSISVLTAWWSAPSRSRTSTRSTGMVNSVVEGASGSLKAQ